MCCSGELLYASCTSEDYNMQIRLVLMWVYLLSPNLHIQILALASHVQIVSTIWWGLIYQKYCYRRADIVQTLHLRIMWTSTLFSAKTTFSLLYNTHLKKPSCLFCVPRNRKNTKIYISQFSQLLQSMFSRFIQYLTI